ncbi:phospholipid phosphatase-related protein type 3 isoform X2 [Entelurus aequoreus]|uniref:phospholipid phosphatase-related protein type 3 isoform X2 n=1 Tax=Entelurus aequoreus TaxID=161455 RepID=UPI002B1E29E7|nr:phospholipid phosphatase-related protein type 3 isoform X2 [Entelurus aequoreus]
MEGAESVIVMHSMYFKYLSSKTCFFWLLCVNSYLFFFLYVSHDVSFHLITWAVTSRVFSRPHRHLPASRETRRSFWRRVSVTSRDRTGHLGDLDAATRTRTPRRCSARERASLRRLHTRTPQSRPSGRGEAAAAVADGKLRLEGDCRGIEASDQDDDELAVRQDEEKVVEGQSHAAAMFLLCGGVHVFGLCATALVTDVIQLSTGYHAPFFLTVCKPNYTHVACDTNAYITKDICSGHDHHAIAAARKTFPSQHATLSAFAAVYVSMYFNSTISNSTKLLKPVLVFFFAIAAALTGLTQITQHRSHPVDIYVGFLIGAFIAAYLAFHAVANFKSSDIALAPPPPPVLTDPLRALTERGHESVYQKGPASASESNDEIAAAPAPLECRDGAGPLQREVASMGSLKRASVDVELLAPRSPMAKETMLTFSNTLPRASINMGEGAPGPVQQIQPVQLRLKAVHVPMDPVSSQRLLTEWKQKSMEMRSQSTRDENETSEDGSEADDRGSQVPICLSGKTSASGRNRTPPPSGAKAVATPRPPQIPEAGPPPVSPKSSVARAKWQAIREKTGGDTSGRVPANQPRLMQVVAMSKQQGLLGSSSSAEKSSETDSTCSGASSSAAAASPRYRQTPEKQREGIVTVDAHASHHPLAQAPPSERNGRPWEWGGGDLRDTYDLNSLQRGDSAACGSSFRPHRSPGAPHSASPQPQFEVLTDAQRKEMAMRRKTALVLLERDGHHADEDNHFKSFQSRRMKD